MMPNWAIVPVKPFVRAKSRLIKVLSLEQRKVLAEKMLRRTIEVLIYQQEIAGISVLSRDPKAIAIARQCGVRTIQESGRPLLNISLYRASELVRLEGWEGLLILPADLPLVTAHDIEHICRAGRHLRTVVVSPDRHGDNTNALFVRPAGLIPFTFGPGSFQRHIELARKAGATVQIYRSGQIELDIDTPTELDLYRDIVGDKGYQELIGPIPFLEAETEMIV